MSGIEIGLIVGLCVSGAINLIVALRNNIKKSKCCFGSEIEFKDGTATQQEQPTQQPQEQTPRDQTRSFSDIIKRKRLTLPKPIEPPKATEPHITISVL